MVKKKVRKEFKWLKLYRNHQSVKGKQKQWDEVFLSLSDSGPWDSDLAPIALLNHLLKGQYFSLAHTVIDRAIIRSALQIEWEYLQFLVQLKEIEELLS